MRATMRPPTHPSNIPPPTRPSSTLNGRNVSVARPRPSSASCPYQALPARNTTHKSTIATQRAQPALEDAFGDERPPDEGKRRPDELHDFNFVTPRIGRQPDDIRDRHRGGDREQGDHDQANRRGRTARADPSRLSHRRS